MKQSQVAKQLGVSEDTITFWENDRAKPLIINYPKIVDFLGYNPFSSDASTLAGKIQNYRHLMGISQEQFGKLIGVNESTIFHWEKGSHTPLPSMLKKLNTILHVEELSK